MPIDNAYNRGSNHKPFGEEFRKAAAREIIALTRHHPGLAPDGSRRVEYKSQIDS
jgi:hypothetical protein